METKEQHPSSRESKLSSSRRPRGLKTLEVFKCDLPFEKARTITEGWKGVSIDTETTGLDYRKDKLMLVQLANDQGDVCMIRRPNWRSLNLRGVLESSIDKVFHHALFDLRFLKTGTGSTVNGCVDCTKTLMKITHPEIPAGLASSLRHLMNVHISKNETKSDWDADELTEEQQWYAAGDVIYLHRLLWVLKQEIRAYQTGYYMEAMEAIRHKVNLEVAGYTDLLDYEQEDAEKSLENRKQWRLLTITDGDVDE